MPEHPEKLEKLFSLHPGTKNVFKIDMFNSSKI